LHASCENAAIKLRTRTSVVRFQWKMFIQFKLRPWSFSLSSLPYFLPLPSPIPLSTILNGIGCITLYCYFLATRATTSCFAAVPQINVYRSGQVLLRLAISVYEFHVKEGGKNLLAVVLKAPCKNVHRNLVACSGLASAARQGAFIDVCLIGGRECSPVAGRVHGDARTFQPTARQRPPKRKNFRRQCRRPRRDVYTATLARIRARKKMESSFAAIRKKSHEACIVFENTAGIAVKLVSWKQENISKKCS